MKRSSLLLESWLPLVLSAPLWLTAQASAQAPAPAEDDVEIEVQAGAPAAPPAPPPAASSADLAAVRAQLEALQQQVAANEAARVEQEKLAEQRAVEEERAADERSKLSLLDRVAKAGVTLSGYVQTQYSRNQQSEDQLLQGGTPLNQDRFAVRRGRLRLKGRWKYIRTDFEVDASTTRGPTASVRRATVSAVLPNSDPNALPYLMLSLGLTEIPLGRELQQGQDQILFLERTTGGLALFAGPVDTGARLDGAYGPFRAALAVMNGVPVDDRASGPNAINPKAAPDLVGRVGFDALPLDYLKIQGGVSFLTGKGFAPGSDASKSVLQWDDSNADGAINAGELVAVAGRGAIPSQTFKHWAIAADLYVDVRSKLGWGRVYGEVTLATNLDRALYVANPISNGGDVRELSWYVAAIQDLTDWGFIGVRYDEYNPNSDLVDTRRGISIPANASIKTLSPVIGARWPGYGRLTFEYDWVKDSLARDTRGVPTDLANNQWTLRAQGEF
jgi:hypothetical protein